MTVPYEIDFTPLSAVNHIKINGVSKALWSAALKMSDRFGLDTSLSLLSKVCYSCKFLLGYI